jgi:hypothetical protein
MVSTPAPPQSRAPAAVVLALVALAVSLIVLSAARYPGGTYLDPSTRGFDLLRNFLCDLMAPAALNGEPNPVGALAAPIGLLLFVAGVAVFWCILPWLFVPGSRLAGPVRALGLVSIVGMAAVPIAPRSLHATAIFAGGVPGIAAAILGVIALRSAGRPERRLAALGAVTLAVALVDGVLYAVVVSRPAEPLPLALPLLQRAASLLLVLWVIAVACRVWAVSAPGRRSRDA